MTQALLLGEKDINYGMSQIVSHLHFLNSWAFNISFPRILATKNYKILFILLKHTRETKYFVRRGASRIKQF